MTYVFYRRDFKLTTFNHNTPTTLPYFGTVTLNLQDEVEQGWDESLYVYFFKIKPYYQFQNDSSE